MSFFRFLGELRRPYIAFKTYWPLITISSVKIEEVWVLHQKPVWPIVRRHDNKTPNIKQTKFKLYVKSVWFNFSNIFLGVNENKLPWCQLANNWLVSYHFLLKTGFVFSHKRKCDKCFRALWSETGVSKRLTLPSLAQFWQDDCISWMYSFHTISGITNILFCKIGKYVPLNNQMINSFAIISKQESKDKYFHHSFNSLK